MAVLDSIVAGDALHQIEPDNAIVGCQDDGDENGHKWADPVPAKWWRLSGGWQAIGLDAMLLWSKGALLAQERILDRIFRSDRRHGESSTVSWRGKDAENID